MLPRRYIARPFSSHLLEVVHDAGGIALAELRHVDELHILVLQHAHALLQVPLLLLQPGGGGHVAPALLLRLRPLHHVARLTVAHATEVDWLALIVYLYMVYCIFLLFQAYSLYICQFIILFYSIVYYSIVYYSIAMLNMSIAIE